MAVDAIHRHYTFTPFRRKFNGKVSEGFISGAKVFILKPGTYMNESGRSVKEFVHYYSTSIEDIIVFHDELDLAPGEFRVKEGGGLAGHNGLKSIAANVGQEFQRVRVGIGHPGAKDRVTGYVLHNFSKSDQKWLDPLLNAMAKHVAILLRGDGALYKTEIMSDILFLRASNKGN